MEAIQIISQDLFDKVRSRFRNLEMGDETGAVTIDPAEARFFDFDFVIEGKILGRVSISLNDIGNLKVYYSQGITESVDESIRHIWYNFLREMRFFAKRRLLRFDTRDIEKTNLDKNDFQHLAATQAPKEEPDMNSMNESRWNKRSTKKTSRAVQGKTEVIVRHHAAMDEMYPGARSQRKHIKAIFIQNSDGERYKYPFIHTAGAFAMAQHVDHGGVPHDRGGKAIIGMSGEIAQLQEFQRKIHRATLHADAHGITERAIGRLNELKMRMESLGKRRHYEQWISEMEEDMEYFDDDAITELDAVAMEEYKSKFTQTSFQEELSQYFPLLHRIMGEANKVNLEDYVSEDQEECVDCHQDPCVCEDEQVKEGAFSEFENWADSVVEALDSDNSQSDKLEAALEDLPPGEDGLPKLQFGDPEGNNAINFFQNIYQDVDVDLESLYEKLRGDAGTYGDDEAIKSFKEWLEGEEGTEIFPGLAQKLSDVLGGSAAEQQPAPEPAPQPAPQPAPTPMPTTPPVAENSDMDGPPNELMANEGRDLRRQIVKMVAEHVHSFYNRDNESVGAFRAEENIATDCAKTVADKFGDRAGEMAKKMAESLMDKLTHEWQERHDKQSPVQDDGLAMIERMRQLTGAIREKVGSLGKPAESIGDIGEYHGNNIMSPEDQTFEDIMKLAGLSKK